MRANGVSFSKNPVASADAKEEYTSSSTMVQKVARGSNQCVASFATAPGLLTLPQPEETMPTLDDLKGIAVTPPPHAGKLWQGVGHHWLAHTTKLHLLKKDWIIVDSTFWTSSDEADLVATFCACRFGDQAHQFLLSIVSSNAQRKALRLYLGVRTVKGVNIYLDCETIGGRHNEVHESIKTKFQTALDWWGFHQLTTKSQVDGLVMAPINQQAINRLLLIAGRAKLLPWSRVGRVDEDCRKYPPTSRWGLLTRFCKVATKNPPLVRIQQCLEFRNLL